MYNGHIKVARLLLERADQHGNPPINHAAQNGHPEIVNQLLDKGADQTVVDQDGDSSLICAIIGGHLEVISLLLDRGSSLAIHNNAGFKPLCLAAKHGHLRSYQTLAGKRRRWGRVFQLPTAILK